MKKQQACMLFSICLFAVLPASLPLAAPPTAEMVEEVKASVTVDAVDVQNRLLTVKDKDGVLHTLTVPDTVKNLAQVKKGDKLVLRYREALVTQILKPGEGSKIVEQTESTTKAPPGAKPAAMSQQQTKATIKVKSVNAARNTLVFVGPMGMTRTVKVQDPAMQQQLKQLKPGDEVGVVYTEALALAVEPSRQQ